MASFKDGSDKAQPAKAATRLQENSSGGRGEQVAKDGGASFAWNPSDKSRPNPQRPLGKPVS